MKNKKWNFGNLSQDLQSTYVRTNVKQTHAKCSNITKYILVIGKGEGRGFKKTTNQQPIRMDILLSYLGLLVPYVSHNI